MLSRLVFFRKPPQQLRNDYHNPDNESNKEDLGFIPLKSKIKDEVS